MSVQATPVFRSQGKNAIETGLQKSSPFGDDSAPNTKTCQTKAGEDIFRKRFGGSRH